MSQRKLEAPVVIIGGGIAGCSTAYYLAKQGVHALVLEKSTFGSEASGRNGGGVRAQCRDRPERKLAMASIKLWETLEEETGSDMEYVQGGNIRLAATEERMAQLEKEAESEWEDGLQVELWNRDELRRRAPYLAPTFIGAKYCATDGIANPLLVTPALAWAAARLGARMHAHCEVLHVHAQGGRITGVTARDREGEFLVETPIVIHAAGPWSPQLGVELGIHIPITPTRSVIAVTQPMPRLFSEFLSAHDVGVYVRPARKGHMHVGGTPVSTSGFDCSTPEWALPHLAKGIQIVPALAGTRFLRSWAGTLAMTPDHLPVLGPVAGLEGYLLATGFSGHGFCLGPIVGKILSELVLEGESSLPIEQLSLARFAADAR
jgi:sarcosine oxidase subunit beta